MPSPENGAGAGGRVTAGRHEATPPGSDFQVFVKPCGSACNLACSYCYYRSVPAGRGPSVCPADADLLEHYIIQHFEAHRGDDVSFSWHGGEPALAGIDYFKRAAALQRRHCPAGKRFFNGMQTNGTLIDRAWAGFLRDEAFTVGISLDGPRELHDRYRRYPNGDGSHAAAMRGYEHLAAGCVAVDVLCVVHDCNVMYPLQLYRFFKSIGVRSLAFLPLVEVRRSEAGPLVSGRSVEPEAFGAFLCTIFDEWLRCDIGRIKIQIFEEAARVAFGQEHSLCLFRPVCGDVVALERTGDLYTCDHFIGPEHHLGNLGSIRLAAQLRSSRLQTFGAAKQRTLPRRCLGCDVLEMCNGECPKNRFVRVEGERYPLNYLCPGYLLFFRHCRGFVEAVAEQWRNRVPRAD